MSSSPSHEPTAAAVTVRPAIPDDLAAITDIYRHYVDNTLATFHYVAPTLDDWQHKLDTITAAGRPFLVAAEPSTGQILGFAYLGSFRDMPSYDWTTEDTIYVRAGAGRRGIGSALLGRLVTDADPVNVRQIIAVIAATGGDGSVALHTRHGFNEVGRLRSVGFKADQWIDCIYMQRAIG